MDKRAHRRGLSLSPIAEFSPSLRGQLPREVDTLNVASADRAPGMSGKPVHRLDVALAASRDWTSAGLRRHLEVQPWRSSLFSSGSRARRSRV
jgi:hypothetical protein